MDLKNPRKNVSQFKRLNRLCAILGGIIFGLVLFCAYGSRVVLAYDVIETVHAPSDHVENDTDCNMSMGGGSFNGLAYCATESGYFTQTNTFISAVALYDVQCKSAQSGTVNVGAYLVDHLGVNYGTILATAPTPQTITCTNSWSANNVPLIFPIPTTDTSAYNHISVVLYDHDNPNGSSKALVYGTTGATNGYDVGTIYSGSNLVPVSVGMYFPGAVTFAVSSTPFSDYKFHQVYLTGSINPQAFVQVSYDQNSTNVFTTQAYGIDSRQGTVSPLLNISDILKTKSLDPGKWYIQAKYTDLNLFYVTSSPIEYFYIATSSGIFPPGLNPTSTSVYGTGNSNSGIYATLLRPPPSTTVTGCAALITNCNQGLATSTIWQDASCYTLNAFQNAVSFAFCPDPGAVNILNAGLTTFEAAPPFNTVFAEINAVSSTLATATSSDAVTVKFSQVQSYLPDVPLISSSTLSGPMGSGTHNAVFNFERAALWLGGAIWAMKLIVP